MINTHPKIIAVIEKYSKLIYAICHGIVNDAHLVEDIAQDVFEKIIRNEKTVLDMEDTDLYPYISVIARNRAIDVSKKESTEAMTVERLKQTMVPTMDFMAEDYFVDEYGFSHEIQNYILKLDLLERDIIILKYGYGYKLREIADLLGQKERYIYHKSKAAHEKLRKAIIEGGAIDD